MYNYIYNKEEKEKIEAALEYIINDIYEICKNTNCKDEIELSCSGWPVTIGYKSICFGFHRIAKINNKGQIKRINKALADYDRLSELVNYYENLREKIVEEVEKRCKRNNLNIDKIDNFLKNKNEEVDVEIDLPPSQNQHQMEIREVEGRTVGTLDFGGRTIRIITDGDLVLVDKRTNEIVQSTSDKNEPKGKKTPQSVKVKLKNIK